MKKLLEVKDLSITFSGRGKPIPAVKQISFCLYEGEKLGIVGESGSGKSVCLKSLLHLLSTEHSATGQALYKGKDILNFSERDIQKIRGKEISMIFQDPLSSLNPTKKIGAQITEGFLAHHKDVSQLEARRFAKDMLVSVGIADPELCLELYPHHLSGGMRQRIMIAIALSGDPKVLFADEPTTALDATVQAQILALLNSLQKKTKMSMILITHDLQVILEVCDRVIVMLGGKIVEEAPTKELFANPRHPYTKMLLRSAKTMQCDPSENRFLPTKQSCPFVFRCPHAMQICLKEHPPFFLHEENQQSACWKSSPEALKVNA